MITEEQLRQLYQTKLQPVLSEMERSQMLHPEKNKYTIIQVFSEYLAKF